MNGRNNTLDPMAPGNTSGHITLPQTAIVDVKPLQPGELSKLESKKMKRVDLAKKLLCSFVGEFVARCLLLALCGVAIWRLTQSDPDFPHWGYALLGIGALLSICDCLQALWYKVHLYAYWRFYKYQHWKGRTWLDPNTVFCLLTIVPALAFTELAIYNAHYSSDTSGLPMQTTMPGVDVTAKPYDVTTMETLLRRRREVNATFAEAMETTYIDATATEPTTTTTTTTTASSTTAAIPTSTVSPPEITETPEVRMVTAEENSTDPETLSFELPERDLSLLLIHHVTCILLVLVRIQIRRPDSLQRIQLNSIAFELLLHAADLDNLIVSGLDERAVQNSYGLFVGVMVLWGIGFFSLVFVLSRRHEADLFPIDRKKLETFHSCVIVAVQDAPRLGLRLAIIIQAAMWGFPPADTHTMFFAMKNALCLVLHGHRIFALWTKGDYDVHR